ncbi:AaceriAGR295Cp [[Ashbya] aceris (nom. inval.)]|nr:AaceriAGR295Cp [[Ashbya] aceris (nom. inval.)]
MFAQFSRRLLTSSRVASRQLSSCAARRDAIQDLYLKELRNTKVAAPGPQDAAGAVRPWAEPARPSVPEFGLAGNAAELEAYAQQPVETVAEEAGEAADAEAGDWLVLDSAEESTAGH